MPRPPDDGSGFLRGIEITRRALFRGAGLSLVVGVVPPAKVSAQTGSVISEMTAYMSSAASRDLPPDAAEHTKHHILDTFASMVSGTELPPGHAAIRFARAYGGTGSGTIVGSHLVANPIEAALVNGVLAHSDETDDSHGPSQSHPGAGVVPAALAAGEEVGIDGNRFLRAVALGYDIGPRMTMAMGGMAFRNESHKSTHSIAGVFGAAAAAASAAGLTAQQMRWVLDYTAQQSSGIGAWARDTDHIEKAFVFGGMPARSGVTAALLVRLGWTGVDDVFSGPGSFFLAYAPGADTSRLIEGLGSRYEVTQTDIKKWTVGTPIQAPLDAVQNLQRAHSFEADDVRSVAIRLAPTVAAVVDNRDIPGICLQHMVAVMLLDKTVSFEAAHDKPRMQDPAVLRQRAKVRLIGDPDLVRFLPVRVAIAEVELGSGAHLTDRVEAVRGTPRNPMSRSEVVDKARDLVGPVLGPEITKRLIDAVYSLEALSDIRQLRPLLQVPPPNA